MRADAGRAPRPHRHGFRQWFHVLEGSRDITTAEDGEIVTLCTAEAGDRDWVPPDVWHGTVNESDSHLRFLVVGVPGTMTKYFAEVGIQLRSEHTLPSTEPPGPAELGDLPRRHAIMFFPG